MTDLDIENVVKFWCYQLDENVFGTGTHITPNGLVKCFDKIPAIHNRSTSIPVLELYAGIELLVMFGGILIESGKISIIQNVTVYDWNSKKIIKTYSGLQPNLDIFN